MYRLFFSVYVALFHVIALFHKKAGKIVKGQRNSWTMLKNLNPEKNYLWFHASSLGEFEQGRPLMEAIARTHPEYSVLLTFYSPSGYEVQKNFKGADLVCYLPFDMMCNVRRFIRLVQPKAAFFIKYEFWPNYLTELNKNAIPVYLVSGVFRKNQLFFKPWGGFYRKLLRYFSAFFVQNEASMALLNSIGLNNKVFITGDTRCDRVMDIAAQAPEQELIKEFAHDSMVLVAGSTWPEDEEIIIPYVNTQTEWKLIIAPHEIDENHLREIERLLNRPFVRYSRMKAEDSGRVECILIDSFGLLSSVYRYGQAAYVGGGFGAGIHNILEAAVYGNPVLFGPNHIKFEEAQALIKAGAAFCVNSQNDLEDNLDKFLASNKALTQAGEKARAYVKEKSGGTARILDILNKELFKA
ncbi:MAG: glycosyltransferase N-terminal domain-containing protein [Bacteroidales bacterium]|nr:glycosyltransferase N-terminal domain-containing protein [Bacteroidales bacterium]MDD3431154.1 glycosyltransferase N-terminal domain-containing protein [Bacteroidales bacterium]MDD4362419.1 glycosyltransferase N-terminal domain-containing protein [Bacteroidales bacterium]MDD4430732.1 glycosyltransferase N-terminal domain-containing protein [Bacteroidales bacterium]